MDTDASRYALHPDNVIAVPKWDGDPKDHGLIGLIPFLECMYIVAVLTVTDDMHFYSSGNI